MTYEDETVAGQRCADCRVPAIWYNNEIQFARLLCELVAVCDDMHLRDCCESMDLTQDQLQELYDRANDVWEKSKQDNCR
jgi:hypothetical protein